MREVKELKREFAVLLVFSLISSVCFIPYALGLTRTGLSGKIPLTNNKKIHTNIGLLGDSRMYDDMKRNFGGFANYFPQLSNQHPSLNKIRFTFQDNESDTSSHNYYSDYFSGIGNNAHHALESLDYVLGSGCDGIMIALGANCSGTPKATIRQFTQILSNAKNSGFLTIMMTIPPWQGYSNCTEHCHQGTLQINDWIRSNPTNCDIVIDAYTLLEDSSNKGFLKRFYTEDGLHLLPDAHRALASAMAEAFTNYYRLHSGKQPFFHTF